MTKLERLPSIKRNKVTKLEEEMLQLCLRKSTSIESMDKIIDVIDENYQLLSPLSKIKSVSVTKNK